MADKLFLLSAWKLGGSVTPQLKPALKTTVKQFRPSHIFSTSLSKIRVSIIHQRRFIFSKGLLSRLFPQNSESICFLPYLNYMCSSSYNISQSQWYWLTSICSASSSQISHFGMFTTKYATAREAENKKYGPTYLQKEKSIYATQSFGCMNETDVYIGIRSLYCAYFLCYL